jgi:hypothetical protein
VVLGAPSFSRTLLKGWVMGPSKHPSTTITPGIRKNPKPDTIVESHPSKTKGGAASVGLGEGMGQPPPGTIRLQVRFQEPCRGHPSSLPTQTDGSPIQVSWSKILGLWGLAHPFLQTKRGCPILARSVRKGGIPPQPISWDSLSVTSFAEPRLGNLQQAVNLKWRTPRSGQQTTSKRTNAVEVFPPLQSAQGWGSLSCRGN